MSRTLGTLLAVGVVATTIVVGIFGRGGPERPIPVAMTTVKLGDLKTTLPETGVLQLPRVVTIPAGVSGTLAGIAVHSGERVAAGQTLATLLNDQLRSTLADARQTAIAAQGRSETVSDQNAILPEQNRSAVLQAQAALVAARSALTQARQDVVSGAQSGLGYGGSTAEQQTLSADATVSKAKTDYAEAKRLADADVDLYANKAISHDALLQAQARESLARVSENQAVRERSLLGGSLSRNREVLADRVRSARDSVTQAEAALAAARASAGQSKLGDVVSARADAARLGDDVAFAQTQVDRLTVRAPIAGTIQTVASQPNDALRPLQPGDAITAGQQLFSLAAGNRFVARVKVDEQDVAGLRLGERATVGGEDLGSATLPGRVVAISPVAQRSDDPSNTARQVLATVALDHGLPYLRDGMSVDVDIITRDERHVVLAPLDAIRHDGSIAYVVVVRGRRALRVKVQLGAQNDANVAIRAGLPPGTKIVATHDPALVSGALVTAASPAPAGT